MTLASPPDSRPALRRGLPRVPGGEPWPPASAGPAVAPTVAPAGAATTAADVPVTAPATQAPLADAAPAPGAASASTRESAADAAATVHLRRGLPRIPGGEPWPPQSAAGPAATSDTTPPAPSAPAAHSHAADAAAAPVDAGAAAATAAATATAAAATVASAPVGATTAPGSTTTMALRRGLPRVPGGEPWPTVESVVVESAAAPVPSTPQAQQTAEDTPASDATLVASPQPAQAPEQAASAAAAAASADAVPAPAASEPAAPAQKHGPLTGAQWAGVGAGVLVLVGVIVAAARWYLGTDSGAEFLARYPGHAPLPENAPVGTPAWLNWAHVFNMFLMVMIIRTGIQIHGERRAEAYWTPRWNPQRKISLTIWFHQTMDLLWVLNGVVFFVSLFATGQWMKIVPTSWDVFPNAWSALVQYASVDWPTENGWVHYNGLQQLAYFVTVFIAAPLAVATGVRMSGLWPASNDTLNKLYPAPVARTLHFPVMVYFVAFIVVHVALVFLTGALRNLNHMFAARGSEDPSVYAGNWLGFGLFLLAALITAGAACAARPLVLAPVARLFGTVTNR